MFSIEMSVFLLPLLFCSAYSTFYKENITDLSRCKVEYSRSEGKYRNFYEIIEKPNNESLVFDFHFLVLAISDAHILLSPSQTLQSTDPVYEIVLGAGSNSYSSIRRQQRAVVKASSYIKGLLSPVDARPFWIHVSKDGLIELGRETEELAFLAWKDPDPLPLQYFSMSTWPGVEAKWFFDCGQNTAKGVEKMLTDKEKLANDLLTNYDPFLRPVLEDPDMINVNIWLYPLFVQLDEKKGILESKFTMRLLWVDQKLIWNPEEYGEITSLNAAIFQIWTPDLRLLSSADGNEKVRTNAILHSSYNGEVSCESPVTFSVRCKTNDLGKWPADTHTCVLSFGFFSYDVNKVTLSLVSSESELESLEYNTEWTVDAAQIFHYDNISEVDKPALEVALTLKRMSNVYQIVYTGPLIVVTVCLLLTFWVSPFGYLKITLASFNMVLITAVIIQIALGLPGHPEEVPRIVLLYNHTYIGVTVSIFISAIVINISRNNHKYSLPSVLCAILMNVKIQQILLLPSSKKIKEYGKLMTQQSTEDPIQFTWILFGALIDRIAFIVYVICASLSYCKT